MAGAHNRGYTSNAGFVVTRDGVVVFDALGTPPLGRAMMTAIREIMPLPVGKRREATLRGEPTSASEALDA